MRGKRENGWNGWQLQTSSKGGGKLGGVGGAGKSSNPTKIFKLSAASFTRGRKVEKKTTCTAHDHLRRGAPRRNARSRSRNSKRMCSLVLAKARTARLADQALARLGQSGWTVVKSTAFTPQAGELARARCRCTPGNAAPMSHRVRRLLFPESSSTSLSPSSQLPALPL